jgi:hypothetical protein
MNVRRRTCGLVASLAVGGILAGGCAGAGLTAKSSCKDFLNASEQTQNEAVSRLAGELHAPDAATPLGRPNINYICASDSQATLGAAVSHTG